MMHKGAQKRIFFDGATYFVTCVSQNRFNYFDEPIFCELFIEILRLAKKMKGFDLYAFIVLLEHFHLMFTPHKPEDLSKIMQFIKRHYTRDINFILGYEKINETEGAIRESLLRLDNKYIKNKNYFQTHYEIVKQLKKQFLEKYGPNRTLFPKFRWQKSFRDHYIRNEKDFDEHLRYIHENPIKHKIPNPEKYIYIYINYADLIDAI